MGIKELSRLQAAGGRLDARLRSALPDDGLVRDGGLVLEHGVRVPDLRRGVVGNSGEPGHQWAGCEMGREVLIGQSVHGLHSCDRAAAVGRHGRPCVATDVFQAGHRLCGRGRAGVHASLALSRLSPVRARIESLLLGIAGAVERVVIGRRRFHVGLFIGMLGGGTFFI